MYGRVSPMLSLISVSYTHLHIHLEKYDKAVMAALILKVEVVDENRLNVVWKHQDIYEKIFSIL